LNPNPVRPGFRSWGFLAVGVVALAVAAWAVFRETRATDSIRVTLTGGPREERSPAAVQRLARLAAAHGLEIIPAETSSAAEALEQANLRTIDFAFTLGGFDFSRYQNLRQVTRLHVEPLHLLVKEGLEPQVSAHLNGLRGKVVNLGGGPATGAYWLAREVMAFAGLSPGSAETAGDYGVSTIPAALVAEERDPRKIPDALFMAATLPSPVVRALVVKQRYRLVALPFREAFALDALFERSLPSGMAAERSFTLLKEHIPDTVIPAFTYQADPGVPPQPIHTLGMTVLLVTHRHTKPETVMRMLDTIYNTRFAKLANPPLDARLLEQIPELPWHPGSVEYLHRGKPILTGEFLSQVGNWFTIGVPTVGCLACVLGWIRQRSRLHREDSFELFLVKVSEIENEAMELELAANTDREAITRLQHALGRVKAEALAKFHNDELQGEALMTSFLTHVNDARDYLLSMLVNQRDRIAEENRGKPAPPASRIGKSDGSSPETAPRHEPARDPNPPVAHDH
jgi:TRAP-type uncharacterized transport system substrate-binding protein